MIKLFTSILILVCFLNLVKAQSTYESAIKEFQEELNEEYKDPDESPLSAKQRREFTGHRFFPIDEKYHVIAKFERLPTPSTFQMKTSAHSLQDYDIFGIATFTLNGQAYRLNIYQSHKLRTQEKYKDYLFLPFTDQTNGNQTYGGGRYIGLSIPTGDTIAIDFNKAYNPYCAYATGYACPIPPKENDLPIEIKAGIRLK
ncbi:DUF1684 domain-containing protein [Algoriphagus halophytocola]|uniref:DUF1684 domain-containing protein n=1 Tax=Algoriphagus halophytocola TaxID=2991499 RepID=A0ABY6MEC8_9BACT|nr:DUF1684 domain-containing protein [Algoriphagus sp. TR-M5]UZD21508.1 DUF1684 domain-containing protein [Algoriphagus sp. TR-M5]